MEHLSINKVIQGTETPIKALHIQPKEETYINNYNNLLFIVGSASVVLINISLAIICIRDAFNLGYIHITHWFLSTIFVFNVAGLNLIYKLIIKENK